MHGIKEDPGRPAGIDAPNVHGGCSTHDGLRCIGVVRAVTHVMMPQAAGSDCNDVRCNQLPRQQSNVSRDLQSPLLLYCSVDTEQSA